MLWSFLYKGGSILISFLLLSLTINYLDVENYGIWLTLSSCITWISFFDIGLGNGLRNKFAEAKAKGDMTLARGYVSSAYFTIGAVSLILIVTFTILNFFFDWTKVLNVSPKLYKDLSILMPIVFGFFCLQMVLKLITTIYIADQNHSMLGKINFYIQVGSLFLIWIITNTSNKSLLIFGSIFSIFPVVFLIVLNWLAFNKRYKEVSPSLKYWKIEYLKDIIGLGVLFFFIQISGIILYTTDNFIISKLFSPVKVVPYNIAYKYMSIASMIFSIIAAPFWTSITDAYKIAEFEWVKNAMKSLKLISYIFIFLIIIMVIGSQVIYSFWIGSKVHIPFSLTLLMAIFFTLNILSTPYTVFLNGAGKVKIQAIQSFFAALINIPLSIYLSLFLGLGTNGIILSTIICFIPSLILNPLQYRKIINNIAKGIWNK
jgi:O-antigen/teichoic acid export membrane protein